MDTTDAKWLEKVQYNSKFSSHVTFGNQTLRSFYFYLLTAHLNFWEYLILNFNRQLQTLWQTLVSNIVCAHYIRGVAEETKLWWFLSSVKQNIRAYLSVHAFLRSNGTHYMEYAWFFFFFFCECRVQYCTHYEEFFKTVTAILFEWKTIYFREYVQNLFTTYDKNNSNNNTYKKMCLKMMNGGTFYLKSFPPW